MLIFVKATSEMSSGSRESPSNPLFYSLKNQQISSSEGFEVMRRKRLQWGSGVLSALRDGRLNKGKLGSGQPGVLAARQRFACKSSKSITAAALAQTTDREGSQQGVPPNLSLYMTMINGSKPISRCSFSTREKNIIENVQITFRICNLKGLILVKFSSNCFSFQTPLE